MNIIFGHVLMHRTATSSWWWLWCLVMMMMKMMMKVVVVVVVFLFAIGVSSVKAKVPYLILVWLFVWFGSSLGSRLAKYFFFFFVSCKCFPLLWYFFSYSSVRSFINKSVSQSVGRCRFVVCVCVCFYCSM